jgi:hypothetical protein
MTNTDTWRRPDTLHCRVVEKPGAGLTRGSCGAADEPDGQTDEPHQERVGA